MMDTLRKRAFELGGSFAAPVGTFFSIRQWVDDRALTVSAQFGDVVLLADRTFTLEWISAAAAFLVANRLGGEVDRASLNSNLAKVQQAAAFAGRRVG